MDRRLIPDEELVGVPLRNPLILAGFFFAVWWAGVGLGNVSAVHVLGAVIAVVGFLLMAFFLHIARRVYGLNRRR